jgi:hypothetical protein
MKKGTLFLCTFYNVKLWRIFEGEVGQKKYIEIPVYEF